MNGAINIEFLGPLHLYVRKEDDCWLAAVDPFSAFGEGETRNEAIGEALDNLTRQLDVLAEEIARHESDDVEVDILCPLRPEDKEGAEVRQFYVVASYEAAGSPERAGVVDRGRVSQLSAARLTELLRRDARLGVAPPEVVCG